MSLRKTAWLVALALTACPKPKPSVKDAGTDGGVRDGGTSAVSVHATSVDPRFTVREHFLAGVEMQLSGEPLAEILGRDLVAYERSYVPTDRYFLNGTLESNPDPAGYSMAVESYEYSKQPMNNLAFESGAGTSLVYGPLVNPTGTESGAGAALETRIETLAKSAHAFDRYVVAPGTWRGGTANPLGWAGFWPTTHVFKSFDPTIDPTSTSDLNCAITSDNSSSEDTVADYECDATSLNLRARETQVEKVVTPGADGFSAWKYGLWVLNYLQIMHDTSGNFVASVSEADLPKVGTAVNDVVGLDADGNPLFPGTYVGSSDVEGFQAGMFLEELDNRAEDWVRHLSTADGVTLGGFASLAEALAYDESKPLRWFPGAVKVTETATAEGFPHPHFAVGSANTDALDATSLAAGYAEVFALTDTQNTDVGGSLPARAYFDGSPFPADNQLADGQATLHDRALAVMRVSLLNLDRLHRDPASGVLVDHVQFQGAVPTRGATASTTYAAYEIVSFRNVLRALTSQLELYSNNTPDQAVVATPLDAVAVGGGVTEAFGARMGMLLRAQAELLYQHLTTADGHAYPGWDVGAQKPTDTGDTLDSHTAAVRGLFAAYLATGDTKYRDRAVAVFNRVDTVFYDVGARLYTVTPAPVTEEDFTPLRFGMLQASLRDMIELIGARPGQATLQAHLEERMGRLNKLVLNGWDDRNGDGVVDWPDECIQVKEGLPRGGLQMAERALTGELGNLETELFPGDARTVTSDREHDCVPEIDDAHLPSALADSLHLTVTRN